jgi:heme/copper-type cytochrome/quinol oxidase subunit 2
VAATFRATRFSAAGAALLGAPLLRASGQTDLQQTNGVVWVMIAMAAVGAIITFSFLVYALWKYRDPKVKHRRYG